MKITRILMLAGAFIGGIYITSEEGKQARKVLEKKRSTFKPIINDLLEQAGKILQGARTIKSSQIKTNIDRLIDEAKQTLVEIDLDKTVNMIKEAISVSSKKIRKAFNELEKVPPKNNKKIN